MKRQRTWLAVLRWTLTRNAVFYVLVLFFLRYTVDYRKVLLKTLDYLSTEPQYLINFAYGKDAGKAWRFRSARRYYQNLARLLPSAKVHHALGFCQYHLGHLDLALQEFREVVEQDPRLHGAVFNAGVIHFEKGQDPEAITAFEKMVSLSEQDLNRLYHEAISPGMKERLLRYADPVEQNRAIYIENIAASYRYLTWSYFRLHLEPQASRAAFNAMNHIMTATEKRVWACQVGEMFFSGGFDQSAMPFLKECVSGPEARRDDAEMLAQCFDKLGFKNEAQSVRIQAVHLAPGQTLRSVGPAPQSNPLYFYPPIMKTKSQGEQGLRL